MEGISYRTPTPSDFPFKGSSGSLPPPSPPLWKLQTIVDLPAYPMEILFFKANNKQEVVCYCQAYIRDNVAKVAYAPKVKVVNQLKFINYDFIFMYNMYT